MELNTEEQQLLQKVPSNITQQILHEHIQATGVVSLGGTNYNHRLV